MIRHPFALFDSHISQLFRVRSPYDLGWFYLSVFSFLHNHEQILKQHGILCKRYKLVKFEDLHRSPDRVMRNVADFFGVKFMSSLLKSTVMGDLWWGNNPEKVINGFNPEMAEFNVNKMHEETISFCHSMLCGYTAGLGYSVPKNKFTSVLENIMGLDELRSLIFSICSDYKSQSEFMKTIKDRDKFLFSYGILRRRMLEWFKSTGRAVSKNTCLYSIPGTGLKISFDEKWNGKNGKNRIYIQPFYQKMSSALVSNLCGCFGQVWTNNYALFKKKSSRHMNLRYMPVLVESDVPDLKVQGKKLLVITGTVKNLDLWNELINHSKKNSIDVLGVLPDKLKMNKKFCGVKVEYNRYSRKNALFSFFKKYGKVVIGTSGEYRLRKLQIQAVRHGCIPVLMENNYPEFNLFKMGKLAGDTPQERLEMKKYNTEIVLKNFTAAGVLNKIMETHDE